MIIPQCQQTNTTSNITVNYNTSVTKNILLDTSNMFNWEAYLSSHRLYHQATVFLSYDQRELNKISVGLLNLIDLISVKQWPNYVNQQNS